MNVLLVGAELEENLGLNYMASSLEKRGHCVRVVSFNSEYDIPQVVDEANMFDAPLIGLSMVFTGRAMEFCRLAQALRDKGFKGHLIAGGHFASFNCKRLLHDFPAFDSVGLGEGEELICQLAENLDNISTIPGICYRKKDGTLVLNPSKGSVSDLSTLPFPKRTTFHYYYDKPIASVLTSRGCWRNCAFCSINAWYKRVGGKKFRFRSVENIVAEIKELYFNYGIRLFNFQDDNFFLPNREKAVQRFRALVAGLEQEGIKEIAIAVKARPDSITRESISELDKLGLFRVFLGVENASERALGNLNRNCTLDAILNALTILNDFDVHVAYNLLMFELDTTMEDILANLRFMERHIENPYNFCRAEAYEGTGLGAKLRREKRLLGDYFGFDYRIKDPYSEAFHQIANYAFFDRNFNDFGLHYFNMQVDFCFQILRRFYPELLTQSVRGAVRNFIKQTNMDTYQHLCGIYDFVTTNDPKDYTKIRTFAGELRQQIDKSSSELHVRGEEILNWFKEAHEAYTQGEETPGFFTNRVFIPQRFEPAKNSYSNHAEELGYICTDTEGLNKINLFGLVPVPIPYDEFKSRLEESK